MTSSLRLRAPRPSALCALLLSLVLVQCGKKSSDDPSPGNALVGSWRMSAFAYKDATGTTDITSQLQLIPGAQCLTTVVLTFRADGTLTGSSNCPSAGEYVDTSGSAKWSTSGNKLTLTDSDGTKEEYDYEISGNSLKLTIPELDTNNKPTGEATIITLTKV